MYGSHLFGDATPAIADTVAQPAQVPVVTAQQAGQGSTPAAGQTGLVPPTAVPAITPPSLVTYTDNLFAFIPNFLHALFAAAPSPPHQPNAGSTTDATGQLSPSPTAPMLSGPPSGGQTTDYSTTTQPVSGTITAVMAPPSWQKWGLPILAGLAIWAVMKPGRR